MGSSYPCGQIETGARRHGAVRGRDPKRAGHYMMQFRAIFEVEGIHPLKGGRVRFKYRADRRPSMPMECGPGANEKNEIHELTLSLSNKCCLPSLIL
mgnify:CR=1 FL=1